MKTAGEKQIKEIELKASDMLKKIRNSESCYPTDLLR